jgi:hypothetical protein
MISVSRSTDWRRLIAVVVIALAVAAALASLLPGFLASEKAGDEGKAETALGPPSRLTMKNGMAVLTLSAAEQQNSGIVTAHPGPPSAPESVIGFGAVLDTAALADLSGRYREAETQIQTAEAKLAVSRAAFERARILYKDQQNISAAQLQSAEGSFEADKAALVAAQSRLTSLAASARQAWGGVLGAALADHAPLITALIERSEYLVKVTLPVDASVTPPSGGTTVKLPGGREIALAFVAPAAATDPRFQGLSYLYRIPAEGALMPGMNLQVRLPADRVDGGVVVPEAAVIWLQGKAWVYLRTDPTTFVRRYITPDRTGPDGGYIVTGLPPEAEIVVRGAQMLLSEEFRAQVPIED